MNQLAPITSVSYQRLPNGALHLEPFDEAVVYWARSTLTPAQLGVWFSLRYHLWMHGELPQNRKRLAAIGGVSPRTFDGMEESLAPLFDHGEFLLWHDIELTACRDRRLGREGEEVADRHIYPQPQRRIDPAKSAQTKAASRTRWDRVKEEKARLLGVDNAETDGTDAAQRTATDADACAGDAVSHAFDDADDAFSDADSACSDANVSCGVSESVSYSSKEIQNLTDSLTDSAHMRDACVSDADGDAKAHAETHAPAADGGPSDAVMIDAIVRTCQGRVTAEDAHLRLPLLRTALAEGLHFFKDILPAMGYFARTNDRVENCANKYVIADAKKRTESRKAVALLPGVGPPSAPDAKVYIKPDSPQWHAWATHRGKPFPTDGNGGWHAPSEWPPRVDPGGVTAGRP